MFNKNTKLITIISLTSIFGFSSVDAMYGSVSDTSPTGDTRVFIGGSATFDESEAGRFKDFDISLQKENSNLVSELKEKLSNGEITQEDFNSKISSFKEEAKKRYEEFVESEYSRQKERLSKLLENGDITEDEMMKILDNFKKNHPSNFNSSCIGNRCLTTMPMKPLPTPPVPPRLNFTDGEYGDYKAKLYEMVKNGELTQEQMNQKLMSFKKDLKEKFDEQMTLNKDKIQKNLKQIKDKKENIKGAFNGLSDDIKKELDDLRTTQDEARKSIINRLKDANLTTEEKEVLKKEMVELNKNFSEKIRSLVQSNTKAVKALDEGRDLVKQNIELRKDNQKAKENIRGERAELVNKYKKAFMSKLNNRLTKLSEEKLEQVLGKIDVLIEKFESNDKLSSDKKDKIVAQLLSLKELINEEIESRVIIDEEINLEELLAD